MIGHFNQTYGKQKQRLAVQTVRCKHTLQLTDQPHVSALTCCIYHNCVLTVFLCNCGSLATFWNVSCSNHIALHGQGMLAGCASVLSNWSHLSLNVLSKYLAQSINQFGTDYQAEYVWIWTAWCSTSRLWPCQSPEGNSKLTTAKRGVTILSSHFGEISVYHP